MPHYVGKRVSYNGKLCTVRYVGSLPGKGDWLGVEWDNPTLGKHDGCYEGSRYFSCKLLVLSVCSVKPDNSQTISFRSKD